MTTPEEQAAEVLAGHMSLGTSGRFIADCGETPETLATALAPLFAEERRKGAEEALREAADGLPGWLTENGMDPQSVAFVKANLTRMADTYAEGGERGE